MSQLPGVAHAHDDLRPNDPVYRFDEYESIVNRDVTIRRVYEWPNVSNPTIYNNISNGLNGFQFSYDLPADQVQVVVQAFISANLAMYDDAVWAKYRLREIFKNRFRIAVICIPSPEWPQLFKPTAWRPQR